MSLRSVPEAAGDAWTDEWQVCQAVVVLADSNGPVGAPGGRSGGAHPGPMSHPSTGKRPWQ